MAVLAPARLGRDAFCNLQLDHDVNGKNLAGIFEQVMQDRRSDVIRQVAINMKIAADEFAKINSEDIAGNDFNLGPFAWTRGNLFLQIFSQRRIGFYGYHSTSVRCQHLGHFSMACTDFDPCFVRAGRKNLENAMPPRGVTKKVLSHALLSHVDAECSNAVRSEAKNSSAKF